MSTTNSIVSDSSNVSSISVLSERMKNIDLNSDEYVPILVDNPQHGRRKKNFLEPHVKKGLYIELVRSSDEMQFIVNNLIQSINEDLNNVHKLLQLTLDVLQINYTIECYSSQDYFMQLKAEVEHAAADQPNVKQGVTIFNTGSQYAKYLSTLIDVFLWHFCKQLTATTQMIPLLSKIMRVFLSFLRNVGQSKLAGLRLTAYIFACRIHKYLSLRQVQIAKSNLHFDQNEKLYEAICDVVKSNKLTKIYGDRQYDHAFQAYYQEFADSFIVCFLADMEKQIANVHTVTFLGDLLLLKNHKLISTVIKRCTTLLRLTYLSDLFESHAFNNLCHHIYGRLNYKIDKIAMLAAGFFRVVFQNKYELKNTPAYLERLLIRSYSMNLALAKCCAKALATYLDKLEPIAVYKQLVNMANQFSKVSGNKVDNIKYAFLVESLHDYLDLLQPQHILIHLKNGKQKFTKYEYRELIEILYHACCIVYKGKVLMERAREDNVILMCENWVFTTTQCLLNAFDKLLTNKRNGSNTIKWVFKALSLITYSHPDVYQFKNIITDVVQKSLKLFDSNEITEDLWLSVIMFIKSASTINAGYHYIIMLEDVLNSNVEKYATHCSALQKHPVDQNLVNELQLRTTCAATKIKTILSIDVSVENIDLKLFLNNWIDCQLNEEIILDQIKISALHFKCRIKSLISKADVRPQQDLKMLIHNLKSDAILFWESMDLYLVKNIDDWNILVESMACFITNWKQLFGGVSRTNPMLAKAYFPYWDNWTTADLIFNNYVDLCIEQVDNMDIPLGPRRKIFDYMFTLYYIPGHPNKLTTYIVKMLVAYEKCFKLHKTVYKHFLTSIIRVNIRDFYYLIVSVLNYIDDKNTDEIDVNVNELCKLFVDELLKQEVAEFLMFLIDFVAENENFGVLKYASIFVQCQTLTSEQQEEIVKHSQRVFPAGRVINL